MSKKDVLRRSLLVAAPAFLMMSGASAGIIDVYLGVDGPLGSPPPGHPYANADAAAADFAAAAASLTTIDFESAPLGNFATLGLGGGVDVSLSGTTSGSGYGGISNNNSSTALGFNTTVGGSQFLSIFPAGTGLAVDASAIFDFTDPINQFGFYITGDESSISGEYSVLFDDGSAQSIVIDSALGSPGGVAFFGFTSDGLITQITINGLGDLDNGTREVVGIDDVQYGLRAAVPEPPMLALWAIVGAAGLLARRRRDS